MCLFCGEPLPSGVLGDRTWSAGAAVQGQGDTRAAAAPPCNTEPPSTAGPPSPRVTLLQPGGKSLSRVQFFVTPWTVAPQAPLSMEFSRQEFYSGLPCSSPGDLTAQRSNLGLTLQTDSFLSEHQGSPWHIKGDTL